MQVMHYCSKLIGEDVVDPEVEAGSLNSFPESNLRKSNIRPSLNIKESPKEEVV